MLDLRTARERLNAAHAYLYRGLIGPIREGLTEGIPAHVERELEHGLDASLSTVQDMLGDADPTRSAVGGEIELIELRSASPSVRLARWLDADPSRTVEVITTIETDPGKQWMCDLAFGADQQHRVWSWGATRGEAFEGALDQAEAATPEGGEDRG